MYIYFSKVIKDIPQRICFGFFSFQWVLDWTEHSPPHSSMVREIMIAMYIALKVWMLIALVTVMMMVTAFCCCNCVVIATFFFNVYQRLYLICWSMKKSVRNYNLFLFPLFVMDILLQKPVIQKPSTTFGVLENSDVLHQRAQRS